LERINERWAMRAGVAAMLAVLVLLGGFSLVTQRRTTDLAQRTQTANRLAATLQGARHWASEEKSVEREYRLAGSYRVREEHAAAGRRLVAALRSAARIDGSAAGGREVADLLRLQRTYRGASARLFAAVDADDRAGVQHWEHEVVDPTYGVLEDGVARAAGTATASVLTSSDVGPPLTAGRRARRSRSRSCAATPAPSSTPRSSPRCAACSTAAAPAGRTSPRSRADAGHHRG